MRRSMRRSTVLILYSVKLLPVWRCKSDISSRKAWRRARAAPWAPPCGTERTWHSHIGMAPGGATKSATPAVMALRGIESNLAELGSCASVTPPASWIARRPAVPSVPMPENTTPAAACPFSAASARKKESIG